MIGVAGGDLPHPGLRPGLPCARVLRGAARWWHPTGPTHPPNSPPRSTPSTSSPPATSPQPGSPPQP